jgi:hypothetical protein
MIVIVIVLLLGLFLLAGYAQIVFPASTADPSPATWAGLKATGAEFLLTFWAGRQAATAMGFIAPCTASAALVTKGGAAPRTAVAVGLPHLAPTVIARDPIPSVQFHVGTTLAVGVQQLGHQEKQVVKPALGQCGPNSRPAVTLAERLALHVWMGHLRVSGGGVRIEGHDAVGARCPQSLPIKTDLETSQIDAFEYDRVGQNPDLMIGKVDFDIIELFAERQEILVDFGWRWDR